MELSFALLLGALAMLFAGVMAFSGSVASIPQDMMVILLVVFVGALGYLAVKNM
jgi:hypothetical protein